MMLMIFSLQKTFAAQIFELPFRSYWSVIDFIFHENIWVQVFENIVVTKSLAPGIGSNRSFNKFSPPKEKIRSIESL